MLRCENVSLTINNKNLFNNLSLEIKAGEVLLIQGPSGSGKTSLLHLFLGFIYPNQGKIIVNQSEMQGKSLWTGRQLISYVDQEASLGHGRVGDVLKQLYSYKVLASQQPNQSQWHDCFKQLNLPASIWSQEIQKCSGGERHRLALAVMLMMNRPIWLIDEPTASLDNHLKQKVVDCVRAHQDRTIIVISHDDVWKKATGVTTLQLGASHG